MFWTYFFVIWFAGGIWSAFKMWNQDKFWDEAFASVDDDGLTEDEVKKSNHAAKVISTFLIVLAGMWSAINVVMWHRENK